MKPAARAAATFLALVGFAHLFRITFGVVVTVGAVEIPVWVSVAAVLVTGGLAAWLWGEGRG